MPRTWRAGGIIGPTTAKQKTPVPEELKSLATEEPGVESPVDGRVKAIREAAEEVEAVAGGSSIRLLIRV